VTRLPQQALESAVIVVAHPDDELLWFASILMRVERVIVCFPEAPFLPALSEGRQKLLAEYPIKLEYLPLAELESFDTAEWTSPEETPDGLALPGAPAELQRAYRARVEPLERELRQRLAGAANVFTHNPWGEYGHEGHVQVHRVVARLATEMGFRPWYGNYASNRTHVLTDRYLSGFGREYYSEPIDARWAISLAGIYRRNGAWTWLDDYVWFAEECFVSGPLPAPTRRGYGALYPLNMLRLQRTGGSHAPAGNAHGKHRGSGLRRLWRRVRKG